MALGDFKTFFAPLLINSIIAIVGILLFTLCRQRRPTIYMPRVGQPGVVDQTRTVPTLGTGLLCWLSPVLFMKDKEYFALAGLDALMLTKFFMLGIKLFAVCSVYGLLVLLPINDSADETVGTNVTEISKLSLSNIGHGSDRLWAHFIGIHINTGFACYLLVKLYMQYLIAAWGNRFSVLFRDIPRELRSPEAVRAKLAVIYDDVQSVHFAVEISKFSKQLAKRRAVCEGLEDTVALIQSGKKRPTVRKDAKYIWCGGRLVDKETDQRDLLRHYNEKCGIWAKKVQKKPRYQPAAFVTFRTLKSAYLANNARHLSNVHATEFTVEPAPWSGDVVWDNLSMLYWQRFVRGVIISAATGWLILFWQLPVAFVQALTSLETLSDSIPFLQGLRDNRPAIAGFVEGFLPTLILIIFFAVLPIIVSLLCKQQGDSSLSCSHMSVMDKLFLFQVLNIFFGSLVAGSIFTELQQLTSAASLADVLDILGVAIPETGSFFINYVMIRSLSGFALKFCRLWPLLIATSKWLSVAKTKRQRKLADTPKPYYFLLYIPQHVMILILGLAFGAVAPLILLFALIFFLLGYGCLRYQMLFVYTPSYERGGDFWPSLFNKIMFGLILSQITLVAIFVTKMTKYQAPMMVPLILATYLFYRFMNKHYNVAASRLPLDKVVQTLPYVDHKEDYKMPQMKEPLKLMPSCDLEVGLPECLFPREIKFISEAQETLEHDQPMIPLSPLEPGRGPFVFLV